jgi:hypothetical protein
LVLLTTSYFQKPASIEPYPIEAGLLWMDAGKIYPHNFVSLIYNIPNIYLNSLEKER